MYFTSGKRVRLGTELFSWRTPDREFTSEASTLMGVVGEEFTPGMVPYYIDLVSRKTGDVVETRLHRVIRDDEGDVAYWVYYPDEWSDEPFSVIVFND